MATKYAVKYIDDGRYLFYYNSDVERVGKANIENAHLFDHLSSAVNECKKQYGKCKVVEIQITYTDCGDVIDERWVIKSPTGYLIKLVDNSAVFYNKLNFAEMFYKKEQAEKVCKYLDYVDGSELQVVRIDFTTMKEVDNVSL